MNKRICAFALAVMLMPASAVYAEKPGAHIRKYDGSTAVWFDIPEGADVTYTTDGSRPGAASEKYRGKIYMTQDGRVRLRVRTGNSTKLYSFGIDVNEKEIVKPRALKNGDTIGVVAPARYIDGDLSEAVALIESRGYKVKLGETCFLKDNGFAGTPKQRADDVNRFFADDEVDAILCLRGGSGSMDMIGMLDYDMIKKHPKMFIGFSDITAVHSALYKKCGLVTVHGPMVSNLTGEMGDMSGYTVSQLFDGIGGNVTDITLPEGGELTALCCGTAQGRIVGGNLSLMCRLIDTPYAVDARGNILVIEDTHESAESIRRKLEILSDSGVTDECAGIVFGQFTDSADSDGESWKDVIADFAEKTGKPCIMGLPAGHENDNMFLPLGVTARMTADESGSGIELLESAYE